MDQGYTLNLPKGWEIKDEEIVKRPAVLSWKNNGYRFGTGCFIKKG